MAKVELPSRIAALEQKLSELKVRQQRQARRERTLQSQRERREDTRRKILVGACLLTRLQRGALTREALLAMLDPFLTRPDDRALFGLPEKPTAVDESASPASAHAAAHSPTASSPTAGSGRPKA